MKLLVTGSSGLVGSACVELFEKKGWDVGGIDNNARSQFFGTPKKTGAYNIDITNFIELEILFKNNKFDAIIHAAAQPSHDWSTDNVIVDFMTNAMGTVFLLELTRKYCPKAVFVHVSTDKVYGEKMGFGDLKLRENKTRYDLNGGYTESLGLDFAGHRSFFGCSKTAADIYAQEYANEFGMKVGIFRPGCITGRNHEGAEMHGFLAYLAKCIREEKTYKVFAHKGKQVRDQIHANDLASAFYAFIKDPKPNVYNIGGGPDRSVSVIEAITMLETAIGKTAKIEWGPVRRGDRQWDVHDVSKFRQAYPEWDYQYSLQDIINDLV